MSEKLKEFFAKALKIGTAVKFIVKIYENNDDDDKHVDEITYLKLGTYLVNNAEKIERIDIILRDVD